MEPHPDAVPALARRSIGLRRRVPLAERTDARELLESDDLSPTDVAANLADLARLNRLPGGVRASIAAIEALVGTQPARVLDAGAGRGDLAIAFARNGWPTVAVDHHPAVLSVARAAAAGEPDVEIRDADALHLPFGDGAFDVAHASLLVHHLPPQGAIELFTELSRVARRGIVINDLRRGLLPFIVSAVPLLLLARSRVTRHDGLVSARRAYTIRELDSLLREAGLRVAWRSSTLLPRVATAAIVG